MFGNHGLGGLPEEGAHEKSPKCLGGNLGDFGEFCKGLRSSEFLATNNHVGNRRVVYTFSTADSFCFCLNDSEAAIRHYQEQSGFPVSIDILDNAG